MGLKQLVWAVTDAEGRSRNEHLEMRLRIRLVQDRVDLNCYFLKAVFDSVVGILSRAGEGFSSPMEGAPRRGRWEARAMPIISPLCPLSSFMLINISSPFLLSVSVSQCLLLLSLSL